MTVLVRLLVYLQRGFQSLQLSWHKTFRGCANRQTCVSTGSCFNEPQGLTANLALLRAAICWSQENYLFQDLSWGCLWGCGITVPRKHYNSICCCILFIHHARHHSFFWSEDQPQFTVSLWACWSSWGLCHWFWKDMIQNFHLGWIFSVRLFMRGQISGSYPRILYTFVSFHL